MPTLMILIGCFLAYLIYVIYRWVRQVDQPILSDPICAKCGCDLRDNWDSTMRCPTCGGDLKALRAVKFGKKFRHKNPWHRLLEMLFIVVLIVSPYILGHWDRYIKLSTPMMKFANLSNSALIANLPSHMDDFMYWPELTSREASGQLSDEDVLEIVSQLTEYLKTKPLSERELSRRSNDLFANLVLKGRLTGSPLHRLLGVYHGLPQIRMKKYDLAEPWSAMHFWFTNRSLLSMNDDFFPQCKLLKLTTGQQPDVPLTLLTHKQLASGQMVTDPTQDISFFGGTNLFLRETLPPGKHVLQMTFQMRLYSQIPLGKRPKADDQPCAEYEQVVGAAALVDEAGNVTLSPSISVHGVPQQPVIEP